MTTLTNLHSIYYLRKTICSTLIIVIGTRNLNNWFPHTSKKHTSDICHTWMLLDPFISAFFAEWTWLEVRGHLIVPFLYALSSADMWRPIFKTFGIEKQAKMSIARRLCCYHEALEDLTVDQCEADEWTIFPQQIADLNNSDQNWDELIFSESTSDKHFLSEKFGGLIHYSTMLVRLKRTHKSIHWARHRMKQPTCIVIHEGCVSPNDNAS